MKFTTLIPKNFNDGSPVPNSLLERLIEQLYLRAGGVSLEREVRGVWTDQGIRYKDVSEKVTVVCERDGLGRLLNTVRRIGRRLKQQAMYVEVFGYDGVQIIEITDRSK